jgi:hypothetical protein
MVLLSSTKGERVDQGLVIKNPTNNESTNYLEPFGVFIEAEETHVEFITVPIFQVAFPGRMIILTVSPKQMNYFVGNVPVAGRVSKHVV